MSRKPIDWTRPLRTTDGHDVVVVERINPTATRPISIHVAATGWRIYLDRDGFGSQPTSVPLVENVPSAPTIVERYCVVHHSDLRRENYAIPFGADLSKTREHVDAFVRTNTDCRVARVLIEEPGE